MSGVAPQATGSKFSRAPKDLIDCLVVGGGPAGLTAAIYLARFHLAVRVIDSGKSRALSIPCTRNHAGFPGGIRGRELVRRMREQAFSFGVQIDTGCVTSLQYLDDDFEVDWDRPTIRAQTVLLATGVTNRRPQIDDALHEHALAEGLLRYCPICDGFEVTDRRIAVMGSGDRGYNEAVFLRGFTSDITLIAPDADHDLDPAKAADLRSMGLSLVRGPSRVIAAEDGRIAVETAEGPLEFETLYPALGSDIHSDLAKALGAATSETGCIVVDSHQRTSIAGLYAAGDVVLGLDQISHAMGEGGVAATTIRNDLASRAPILR